MNNKTHVNRVLIRSSVYEATPIATTQEDNHFGVEAIWDLTDADGNAIPRGLVKWFDASGGGWGFSLGEQHERLRLETREVVWLEVDDGMRRWLMQRDLPQSLFDMASRLARLDLGIDTLEERGRDALDFHEVGVVSLRRALETAYLDGMGR